MTATRPSVDGGFRLDRFGAAGGRFVAAVGISAVLGVVVALLALPAVSLVGVTAKASADSFLNLPTDLKVPPLAQASRVLNSRGQVIATLRGAEDREIVRLSRVPKVMRQAIVDIEDSRFYTRKGLDFKGLARAYLTNQESGGVTQGGSTLAQQYVKNVLLESANTKDEKQKATEQTVRRKLREARYALHIEATQSKDQILENYLNIAYFGDGAYGIQAAARHYFNVDVSKLNVVQSATLAGLVKNPTAFDPILHPDAARTRRNTVLDRMFELKHLSPGALKYAKAVPLGLHRPAHAQDSCELSSAAFFCAYVRRQLLADERFGATQDDRARQLYEGGLTIRTTIDPQVQAAAQNAVDSVIPPGNRVAASIVVIEPGTGNVLAMAVNRKYAPSRDNKSADKTTDFVNTKYLIPADPDSFSPGSTFKAFALTAAIEQGLPLNTTFNSPPCYTSKVFSNPASGCFSNAEASEGGFFSLTTATWDSVNTYYIQLEEKVGVTKVAEMARRLGVSSYRVAPYDAKTNPGGVSDGEGSVVLGSHEASTIDMATAYATLAAHGKRCDPKPISSILHTVGIETKRLPYTAPRACRQVISPEVADKVSSVLQGVITNGTGNPNAAVGRQAAGKTGTAENHSDAWFVGFIPQLAAAVTVADPRSTVNFPLQDVVLPGGGHTGPVFGGGLPAMIWSRAIRGTIDAKQLPVVPMPAPDNTQPAKQKLGIPDLAGKQYDEAKAILRAAKFDVGVRGVDNPATRGTVLGTDPGAGTEVDTGSRVTLIVSNGGGGGGGNGGGNAGNGGGGNGGNGGGNNGGGNGGGGLPDVTVN